MTSNKEAGFTLVELAVVMVIIAVLIQLVTTCSRVELVVEDQQTEEYIKQLTGSTVKSIEQRLQILDDENLDVVKRIALAIDGAEYREETTKEIEQLAKQYDIVIVFGASDDLLELRGAIYDELDAFEGGRFHYDVKDQAFANEDYVDTTNPHNDRYIDMTFSPDDSNATWLFDTNITGVEKFNIYEDGSIYGNGLVIPLENVKPQSE